uniref:calpain-9-like n=1 Tax=Myxine glutinosa TaxID=7769 RepID=UPI00358ECB2D
MELGAGREDTQVRPYQGQVFEDLRAQCLRWGDLYRDDIFPASLWSLGRAKGSPIQLSGIQWKRPKEICSNPLFISENATRTDIVQGALGDCWLLSCLGCLTLKKKLIHKVLSIPQSFTKNYAGIFHFQFWWQGSWTDVVVDDRLPVKNDHLVFLHSGERNEFWSALLEKAYAKLHGSYEALHGGITTDAMVDLTSGVCTTISMEKPPDNLHKTMKQALRQAALVTVHIQVKGNTAQEAALPNGLLVGHSYSVTGIDKFRLTNGKIVHLVRLRNPWGKVEWNGPWSDGSKDWETVSRADKDRMALVEIEDGEFWMEFQDLEQHFHDVNICYLSPVIVRDKKMKRDVTWTTTTHEGSWIPGVNAGGCTNHKETYWTNPQFMVHLEAGNDSTCFLTVALMQKRHIRALQSESLYIGFSIYRTIDSIKQLTRAMLQWNAPTKSSGTYMKQRQVNGNFELPPGDYIIIPTTFDPDKAASFILRVFTANFNQTREIDNESHIDGKELDGRPAPTPLDDDEEELMKMFRKLAREDNKITEAEISAILNKKLRKLSRSETMSVGTCGDFIGLYDVNNSKAITFPQLKNLWKIVRKLLDVFDEADRDNSGALASYELRPTLEKLGIQLSNELYKNVVLMYKDSNNEVDFESFVCCVLHIKTMFRILQSVPKHSGNVVLGADKFLHLLLRAKPLSCLHSFELADE